jgi:ribonuclease HI
LIVAGDITYSKIYSDGSCREGNIRSVARAGWGVFVAPDSPHNFHAPLDGPVQTSYRAELNAVLHILRHTVAPTMIMCDCQSVVKTLTRLLEDGIIPANVQEQDIWDQITELTRKLTTKDVCIQWMPGHFNEPHKAKLRYELLKNGTITQANIKLSTATLQLTNWRIKELTRTPRSLTSSKKCMIKCK